MKGVLIAWFWVTMTKIGKFQQNRWLCVAQLFKWLQRIAHKTWVQSQTQNKGQWLAACGHVSASSQSLSFILSLRLNSKASHIDIMNTFTIPLKYFIFLQLSSQGLLCVRGGGGGGAENIFSYQRISQRVVWISLEKQLDPRDPIASRWGSVPVFVEKHIATCDFPGVSGALPHPPPPWTRHWILL